MYLMYDIRYTTGAPDKCLTMSFHSFSCLLFNLSYAFSDTRREKNIVNFNKYLVQYYQHLLTVSKYLFNKKNDC